MTLIVRDATHMNSSSSARRLGRRQALAAKVNPSSRLSVEAGRLLAAVLRGGALPATAELKAIEDSLREVGGSTIQAPSDVAKLWAALTHIFIAIARWPQPRSAGDVEVQRTAWHVFIKAHSSLKLLLQPSGPVTRAVSAWAPALLRSNTLQCLSRQVHAATQAVYASMHPPVDSAHTKADPKVLSMCIVSSMALANSIAAAAYAGISPVPPGTWPGSSGTSTLRQQLMEAVRSSHVLEHVARGMAVLTMHRGAAVAQGQNGVDPSPPPQPLNGISRAAFNTAFLSVTSITPGPANVAEQQQQQQQQVWPPSVTEVDPTLFGPWSRHLLLAWGLHHLHALDGGGHCGLHPDMVRGLPPAWEPPPAPQAAGPSTGAGPGASGAAAGPHVLKANALWRLMVLLEAYTSIEAPRRPHGMPLARRQSGQAAGAEAGAGASVGMGAQAAKVERQAQMAGGVAVETELPPEPGSASALWDVPPGALVRRIAARVVRVAASSARVWQGEEGRGGGEGGPVGEASTGGLQQSGGCGSGGALAADGRVAEGPTAAARLVIGRQDAVGLGVRGVTVCRRIAVQREVEEGQQQGSAETAHGGEGASEAGRSGRRPALVRPWTEVHSLGSVVVEHLLPWAESGNAALLALDLQLDLPLLPSPGSLPACPPPRLSAALQAGFLPSLERLARRCGREVALPDLRVLMQLLGPGEGAGAEPGRKSGPHDLLWLLAYGDRDQAGAVISSLSKALVAILSYQPGQRAGGAAAGAASRWQDEQVCNRTADLHMVVIAALAQGMDWCDRAMAAGTGPEQQLRLLMSHAVHELRGPLFQWTAGVVTVMRALVTGQEAHAHRDGPGLLNFFVRHVPAVLRMLLLTARSAMHAVSSCSPEERAAGRVSVWADAGVASSRREYVGSNAHVQLLSNWLETTQHLPPPARLPVVRAAVDVAWCLAALVSSVNCNADVGGGVLVVGPPYMEVADDVARDAGDAETAAKARAYLDWSLRVLTDTSQRGHTAFASLDVPTSCLRLEGGAPWLLSAEEVRRRLPRSCWNGACERLEGDSEAGVGLMVCGRCRAAWYCCRECQAEHWSKGGHRAECGKGREKQEGYSSWSI